MDPSPELINHNNATNSDYQSGLNLLRTQIDKLDKNLLNILCERMRVSGRVGELKKRFDKPARQPDRENALLEQFKTAGATLGLSPEFSAEIFKAIHTESVNIQNKIINSK